MGKMTRKMLRVLGAALMSAFMLGSIAEAAPARKALRHRPRHSSRVTSGSAESTATEKKTTVRRKKKGPE